MQVHRYFSVLSIAASVLLAQSPKGEAATPSLPGSSISVPLVSEGLSPSFQAVASRLEVGGYSFSYNEAKGAVGWASFFDDVLKSMSPAERKDIPPNFSFASLFSILGLDAMAATGTSCRQRADGSFHSRAFAYMPKGRKGLMSLTGGPATKLMLMDLAPKDTDFGLEFSLNLKDFTQNSLPEVLNMMPPKEREKFQEEISQPIPNVGITTKQVLENLNLRVGIFLRLDPTHKIPVDPKMPPITAGDGLIVIDGMGWLINGLKPLMMVALQDPKAPVSVTDDAGILNVRMKQAVGPAPMDYQPVMRFDAKADRLIIASRPQLLEAALTGTDKFEQRADFAEVWRDLPKEGNDCVFISKRFFDTARDFTEASVKSDDTITPANRIVVTKMFGWMKDLFGRSQAIVLANEPDGISTHANLAFSADLNVLTTITTISILSSLAVPTFAKINQKSQETREINNARQVVIALRLYASDHQGKYPKNLASLTAESLLPDANILEYTDPVSKNHQAWLFNSKLNDSSPGTDLLLVAPIPLQNGSRIGAFNDGSVRKITDAEYQRFSTDK